MRIFSPTFTKITRITNKTIKYKNIKQSGIQSASFLSFPSLEHNPIFIFPLMLLQHSHFMVFYSPSQYILLAFSCNYASQKSGGILYFSQVGGLSIQIYNITYITYYQMNIQSDKNIHLSPSKSGPQQFSTKLNNLQKKSMELQNKSKSIIDDLINVIENVESQLEGQQISQQQYNSTLTGMHKKLTQVKPLKRMKDQFYDFYKKMSGVVKMLDENQQQAELVKPKQIFTEQQIQQLEEGIAQHFYREGQELCANSISQKSNKKQIFQECFRIKNNIKNGQYEQAISWVEREDLFKKKGNLIEYELKKLQLLKLIKNQQNDNALQYYRREMPKFFPKKQSQVNMLIGFMMSSLNCYWANCTDYENVFKERYRLFSQIDINKIAEQFVLLFYESKQISKCDSVLQCYEVGRCYQNQFIKNIQTLPNQNIMEKVLPFSIQLDQKNQFHSLFFCPITKEIYDSKDGGALLQCGHIVSIAAMRKIQESRDNRRAQKCPVCQKEIQKNSDIKVHF